jgi:hypothetical protein
MSLFLGKIHFWLYNKIQWFEAIEEDIIRWAGKKGLPVDSWVKEINEEFGQPTGGTPLEEVIDSSNIHGWLQEKIQSAELRQAALATRILEVDSTYRDELVQIYKVQGENAASAHGDDLNSADDIYQVLNDYLLEGMPCDRVTEIMQSDENEVVWNTTTCLHKPYWEQVGGNVSNFYIFREAWTKGFVSTLNSNFKYISETDGTKRILRV